MNYLAKYQVFNNKEELNYNVSLHSEKNRYNLNKTDFALLTILSRYSVKYPGVAHLKIQTLMDKLKKSRRTVQRSINKLEELRIIKKETFIREKSGGYGANLFIFLHYNDTSKMAQRKVSENIDKSTDESDKKESEPFISSSYNNNYNNTYHTDSFEEEKTPYQKFKDLVKSFLGDKKIASRLYGVYLAQTKALRVSAYSHDDLIDTALKALHITFNSMKTKSIKNVAGYFNGVMSKKLDSLMSEAMNRFEEQEEVLLFEDAKNSLLHYNWLES